MRITFQPIMTSALRRRILRQNPDRVRVDSYRISAGLPSSDTRFFFHLQQGTYPQGKPYGLPGDPFRVTAVEAALPLIPVGRLDYRIVRSQLGEDTAVMDTSHERGGRDDKVAIRVEEEAGRRYRGIGRAMASIAFNHAASDGVKAVLAHNVLAYDFFIRLSKKARVVEVQHEDLGPVELEEVDPADTDVVVNMEIDISNSRYIPRIEISLRSGPIRQV